MDMSISRLDGWRCSMACLVPISHLKLKMPNYADNIVLLDSKNQFSTF